MRQGCIYKGLAIPTAFYNSPNLNKKSSFGELKNSRLPAMTLDPSSFRDPAGFVFSREGVIYRAAAPSSFPDLDLLHSSGLYDTLVAKGLLVKHAEASGITGDSISAPGYRILHPEQIPFISYLYEWCFSQLKQAALLTLSVQLEAMKKGMSLKDASAFNVQFIGNRPVFIDTLSFEKYEEGKPWVAYGQFCRHFLAPLSLMTYRTFSLGRMSQLHLDGIPLELASTLLPKRALLNTTVLSHLHLHAKFQSSATATGAKGGKTPVLPKSKLIALLQHLEGGIKGLNLKKQKTTWINYGEFDNYTKAAKEKKHTIISGWLQQLRPGQTWDLGCNTGEYAMLAAGYSTQVLAMDFDAACIESLYKKAKATKTNNVLPLVVDLTNPTPAIGWDGKERCAVPQRGRAGLLLGLALVHHLRIGNNTPWEMIAKLFSEWGEHAIVEFVPREDSQVQLMLSQRKDIFTDLDKNSFENSFKKYFEIIGSSALPDSSRILYLLKRKTS